jgi:Rrf2 family protein
MITRATEYAFLTLIYLAKRPIHTISYSSEIAEAEQIPIAFLSKLVPKLVKAGLIHSRRGSQGGLEIAKSPNTITAKDVMDAIEGTFTSNICTGESSYTCFRNGCGLKSVFAEAQQAYHNVLQKKTLADILQNDHYTLDRPLSSV